MTSKERITATSEAEAWKKADAIFGGDYELDEVASKNAGYKVYRSTAEGKYYWYICDLGTRLEVNMDKETVNIWIEPQKYTLEEIREYIASRRKKLALAAEVEAALEKLADDNDLAERLLGIARTEVRNLQKELSAVGL